MTLELILHAAFVTDEISDALPEPARTSLFFYSLGCGVARAAILFRGLAPVLDAERQIPP